MKDLIDIETAEGLNIQCWVDEENLVTTSIGCFTFTFDEDTFKELVATLEKAKLELMLG